jgi:hypothetical protein
LFDAKRRRFTPAFFRFRRVIRRSAHRFSAKIVREEFGETAREA